MKSPYTKAGGGQAHSNREFSQMVIEVNSFKKHTPTILSENSPNNLSGTAKGGVSLEKCNAYTLSLKYGSPASFTLSDAKQGAKACA